MNILSVAAILLLFSCTAQPEYQGPNAKKQVSESSNVDAAVNEDEDSNSEDVVEQPEEQIEEALGDAIEQGNLMVQWIHGSANCNQDQNAAIQVHQYSSNIYILRQNKCQNFEAPFIYLILGSEKAFMLDSGAQPRQGNFPIRNTVEGILQNHYKENRPQITLVVAHTHSHGDHIAGDNQFQGQDQTVVVGTQRAAVAAFFGIQNWPEDQVVYELGDRPLDVLAIPGHQDAHIAVYDRKSKVVFTGDSLYPGRLYIDQWQTYRTSVTRLTNFFANKEVTYVLGAHIEMSDTPGQDYPIGTTFQPNEHKLELNLGTIQLLNTELQGIGAQPMRKVTDSFIISP